MGDKKKVIHIDNLPSVFKGKYRNNRFVQTGNPPIGLPFDKVSNLTGLLRLGSEFISSPTNTLYNPDGNKSIIIDKAKDVIDWYNKPGPSFPYNLMKQEVYQTDDGTIGRKTFSNGGKTNKIPNVVNGGIAQPLGNNFFYMNGRKHSQGGIDIGPSDKTGIEVEDGEVVETNGNELKVYSAQPIINGISPARLVMGGANPNKVFKAQEDFKDRNGINDDGTKAKYGKEKHVAKSDNTRVVPIMESPRDNSIKQGDFVYYPETYRIANNTLERVPARREVNMTPLEQVNPEFDILLGGAGVLRGVDKATKVAMALDKNISRVGQKAITKGRDALGYYSISPNIRYNLSVNNGRKALGIRPTKLLDVSRKKLTSNISKYNNYVNILDSSGEVINIPDILQSNIDDTKAFLKTFNKWNAHYGYDPIPLSAAKNPKQADKLIKDRLLEHNTFIRGVHETGNAENINNILRRNGIEPTAENRAKYYASTYAPDTGAGRAGFTPSHLNEGTIYSSNSLNTGIGYAKAKRRYEKDGYVVSVRRPINFEGKREDWVRNADFAFDNHPQSRIYTDYELPYLLRYGKSARYELSKNKEVSYNDIISKVNNRYRDLYKYYDGTAKHVKELIDDPNIKYKPSYNITGNPKNDYVNTMIGFEFDNINKYNPYNYGIERYVSSVANKKGIDVYDKQIIFNGKDFEIHEFNPDAFSYKNSNIVIPEKEVKDAYYKDINNKLGKLVSSNYRKSLEKQFDIIYKNDINKRIKSSFRISNDELKDFVKSKGIYPENKKYNVITSEALISTSRNKGNPYQHFIFTGDVGKQGLDVVDIKDVNSEEFKRIFNTRQHIGKYSKGYSRKSRKLGGKDMIVSISGNVKNGLIHSPSSTGGLRDKFRVGGKRINRDGRTWEYNEEFGAYVPITNRSISRTSAYPIDKSARGETVTGSEYTFKNGRWRKNDKVDNNTTVHDIDNGNRRPQYYAERELPLFNDGAGITSGLVRAGWSHGNNNKKYDMDNIDIPNVPNVNITKSKGQTPRRGGNKQNQSVQSTQVNTPPIAVYNRNLPKVEADIPTTLPVSTRNPIKGNISSDSKGQGKFKNITTADWIGLGSNIAGSLASYFSSRSVLNKMKSPSQPMLISANKLKTRYNINPQLDRIREDKFASYRDIDSNTASSRVSLARKQRVRNAAGQASNELYGNKENIEINLINQDRRNQQSVRQFNAQQYNQYLDRKTAFDNGIREAKLTNVNNLFTGINAGIQDMITRYENRKALNNTIDAMRASAPNVDDRIMRDAGVDYDEFIIRKRRKLGGKQSCR